MTDTLYGTHANILAEVKARFPQRATEVETLTAQATAYVWGYQDAQGPASRDTGSSMDFGYSYGIYAAEYALERRWSRRSIGDAFDAWREHGNIAAERHPGEVSS
jgi:hypothetical protein